MTRSDAISLRSGSLRPRFVEGELAGLEVGDEHIPFPGVGVETELGSVVPGAGGEVRSELQRLLKARDGIPADPKPYASCFEWGRLFNGLGSTYLEGTDHLELNTWLHRGATAARANLEALLADVADLVARSHSPLILHATGGDGHGDSWSSLHVNVPISDRTYAGMLADQRYGSHFYDYHLLAQITLCVVDGNGGIGDGEYLLSDRIGCFDRVFGAGTLRPSRAMIVDRAEGFGTARIMNMMRALSFGAGSAAGFLATQIDCLAMQLVAHGVLEIPSIRVGDPVEAGRFFAASKNRREAARIQRRVQIVRRGLVEALVAACGEEVVRALLPGAPEMFDFIDRVLAAVESEDEATLVACTDWARKWQLVQVLQRARRTTWRETRPELLELNVHWARLDERALRHRFPESAVAFGQGAECVPQDTSSWLLHAVVSRATHDAAWRESLRQTSISWKGLECAATRWSEPAGGYFPYASRETRTIELIPWSHTKRTHGDVVAGSDTLDDLFDRIGTRSKTYGNYAGESSRTS